MTEPRIITLDEIVAIDDLPEEVVEVPEWDGLAVRIRGLTIAQHRDLRRQASGTDGKVDFDEFEILFLARSIVEPELEPAVIRGKSVFALQRILNRCYALSGIGREVVEAAKKTFPPGAGDPDRLPVGDEAVDDGGGSSPADERPGEG